MQLKKSTHFYLLILVLLTSNLSAYAQKPPTGGPNPSPDPTNLVPIIAGGGIALGAATYFIVRNRGPKIAVHEHLYTYLLDRNILPTPDAVDLMHELNPRLNNREVMRANKKLVDPDFPEIPKNLLISGNAVQTTTDMPVDLKEEVEGFASILNTFRNTGITTKPGDPNVAMGKVNLLLREVERNINSTEWNREESNPVTNQLMTDLLKVLNQTLEKTIATKIIAEKEMNLIQEISENFSELLLSVINPLNPEKSSQLHFSNPSVEEDIFLATVDENVMFYARSNHKKKVQNGSLSAAANTDEPVNTNLLQAFAFAVHKINPDGEVITKGPEVEGKYLIKYVSPALKSFPEAYHDLSPLATYASAYLPPAKLYIIVEDINGKQVDLARPLIDFKAAFKSPQREQIKEMIIVTLNITND